ncbi:MAG TPA: helix-turn-helix domain-containing protein [bacterium]|nr:helix-turn-helix domain-containing protein [bacterium]
MSIILALGAFPGIIFAVIKIFNKSEDISNRILGTAIFFYSTMLLLVFLGKHSYISYSKEFIVTANTFISVSWPLFYLYIQLITGVTDRVAKKHLIHIIPFSVYVAFFVIPALTISDLPDLFFRLSFIYSLFVSFGYSLLMFVNIRAYKIKFLEFSSEENTAKVSWLKYSVLIWLFIEVLQFVFVPMRSYFLVCCPFVTVIHEFILNTASVSWIYLFAYFAISHPDIFSQSKKMTESLKEEKLPSSTISDDYAEIIGKRIEKIMTEQKPYLNFDLTIATLGEMINVQPYLLGRYINNRLGKNFMTYINELRIQEVKSMFANPEFDDRTILEISLQSGFRTKSAFNSFFKRSTGATPLEYRKSIKQSRPHS